MGYASYFEDIDSKSAEIERIVLEYSKPQSNEKSEAPESLRAQNKRLQDGMNKLRKEIEALNLKIQQIKKDKAEQSFLLRREQGKTNSLSKEIGFESDLRKTQEKVGRSWSELVLDFENLFQVMSKIVKSNAWYKDRNKIKQIESLIETGLRKA